MLIEAIRLCVFGWSGIISLLNSTLVCHGWKEGMSYSPELHSFFLIYPFLVGICEESYLGVKVANLFSLDA